MNEKCRSGCAAQRATPPSAKKSSNRRHAHVHQDSLTGPTIVTSHALPNTVTTIMHSRYCRFNKAVSSGGLDVPGMSYRTIPTNLQINADTGSRVCRNHSNVGDDVSPESRDILVCHVYFSGHGTKSTPRRLRRARISYQVTSR